MFRADYGLGFFALASIAILWTSVGTTAQDAVPTIHINDGAYFSDFDAGWCRGSMIPEQDPNFPTIQKSRFDIDPVTDVVRIPPDWILEARDVRVPQLKRAADARIPSLLLTASSLVGRPFKQMDFDYFFYLCPYFGGGTASAKIYPMFMYLKAAVGDYQWPDWLFTDQYLFHEVLHNYVMEKIDYTKGTPILNGLYALLLVDSEFESKAKAYLQYPSPITPEYAARWASEDQAAMIGLVLTHVHVYGIMTEAFNAIGPEGRLETIRQAETSTPASHPSYVRAWKYIESIEKNPVQMRALLDEVK
jgi:hypothetical protein